MPSQLEESHIRFDCTLHLHTSNYPWSVIGTPQHMSLSCMPLYNMLINIMSSQHIPTSTLNHIMKFHDLTKFKSLNGISFASCLQAVFSNKEVALTGRRYCNSKLQYTDRLSDSGYFERHIFNSAIQLLSLHLRDLSSGETRFGRNIPFCVS